VRIALHGTHPALDFVRPLLARNYDLVGADDSPEALVAFEPVAAVPDSVELAVFVAVRPPPAVRARTLVIGAAPEDDGASHASLASLASLATDHPAELLSLIDGFLRYPARFPVGDTASTVGDPASAAARQPVPR
jgi:hypothetical protein